MKNNKLINIPTLLLSAIIVAIFTYLHIMNGLEFSWLHALKYGNYNLTQEFIEASRRVYYIGIIGMLILIFLFLLLFHLKFEKLENTFNKQLKGKTVDD